MMKKRKMRRSGRMEDSHLPSLHLLELDYGDVGSTYSERDTV